MAIRKRESNGEYWGNDLWRHWCHFLCKLINRTYYVFLIHDVRRRKVIKYYKKQKVWKLTIKNFSTFCHRTFCKQLFYHFCHYIKQKQKFLLGNQDIKKTTKKWTVNVLNPNKQRNIHLFQGEYRISGALNVLLPELHLSFTRAKNKEQQGQFSLIQLLLGYMHSALNN